MNKKKLTVQALQQEYGFLEKYRNESIGDGWIIGIKEYWSDADIAKLIQAYASAYQKMSSKGTVHLYFDDAYMLFLVVKFFTDLGEDISEDIDEQISTMAYLSEAGILAEISSKFSEENMKRLEEKIMTFIQTLTETTQSFEQEVQAIGFTNEEVKRILVK